VRCPPDLREAGARKAISAVAESQTVGAPHIWNPAAYSAQFDTRYRDLAHAYRLRFGYFMVGESGSGA
jgi:hypothetical protein